MSPASVGGRLSRFRFLRVVSAAAVNEAVHVAVWVSALNPVGSVPRGGTAGPSGNSVCHFLRKRQTVSHSGCTFCVSSRNAGFGSPVLTNSCDFLSFLKVVVILMDVNLFLFLMTEVSNTDVP